MDREFTEASKSGDVDEMVRAFDRARTGEIIRLRVQQYRAQGLSSTVFALTLKDQYDKLFAIHAAKRRALEKRIEALEAQQKAMRYRGVWQPAEVYERGNLATYDGSLWVAIDDSPGKPGASGWQLAAKRGRDAA